MTPYNLFLDDIRNITQVPEISAVAGYWVVVRSYEEFCKTIEEKGIPQFISYDHDLCLDAVREFLRAENSGQPFDYRKPMKQTGLDCVIHLFSVLKNTPHPPYFIHSSNFIGAKTMNDLIIQHNQNVSTEE